MLGVITAPHGVRGLVRVKSFTADPDAIASYGPLENEQGTRRFALERMGTVRGAMIARIDGIDDRDAAERLRGVRLYVGRDRLPPPDPEEYYVADLVGLEVRLENDSVFGRVRAVHEYGAGDSLEIERPDGRAVLVPFTRAVVPVVDIAGGRLVVDPPAGLFDATPETTAEDEEA